MLARPGGLPVSSIYISCCILYTILLMTFSCDSNAHILFFVSVGCLLGFSLHCDTDNDIKGLLPIVTTHAFHRGVNDCYDDAGCEYFLYCLVFRML